MHCFTLCRRESTSIDDLFYGHRSGMDGLARGLRNAAALIESGKLDELVQERYATWHEKGGIGQKIISGKVRCGCTSTACGMYTITLANTSFSSGLPLI